MVTLDTAIYQPGHTADVTPVQMLAVVYANGHRPAYDRAKMDAIAHRWAYWSDVFGFLRSVTWGQAGHETGWFWSRVTPNQVQPSQNNWGGLGADNSGAAGAVFGPDPAFPHDDPQLSAIDHGIVAYMCHLALYIHGEPARWPERIRPYAPFAYRLDAVRWAHANRRLPDGSLLGFLGVVTVLRDFVNCRWAHTRDLECGTLANGYARGIEVKANEVLEQTGGSPVGLTEIIRDRIAARGIEVHDLRDQLERHASKSPETRPPDAWRYIAIHHTGVSRGRRSLAGDIESWQGHAQFHVHTRGWPTIAYDIGVSLSGRLFILQDIAIVGYHAYEGANYQTLAIAGDLTGTNTPTPEMLAAIETACDVFSDAPELPSLLGHTGVYGHDELVFLDSRNSTDCPGELLSWAREYRNRTGPQNDPNAEHFEETGHWIVNQDDIRMLDLWRDLGGLEEPDPVGYPLSGMTLDEDGVYRQICENRLLEWRVGQGGRSGGLGQRYMQLMGQMGRVQLAMSPDDAAV